MLPILEWEARFTFDKNKNPLAKVASEISSIRQEDMPQLELVIQVWGKTQIYVYLTI